MEMTGRREETVTAIVTLIFRGSRGRGRGRGRATTGGGTDHARAINAAIEAGTIDAETIDAETIDAETIDAETIDATIGAIAIEAGTGNAIGAAIEAAIGVAIGAADVGERVAR